VRDLPYRHRQDRCKKRGTSTRRQRLECPAHPWPCDRTAKRPCVLARGLTPAPGPDPAPASGPPAGLACANWSSCRGQHRGPQQASRWWTSRDDSSCPPAHPDQLQAGFNHATSSAPSPTPRKKVARRDRLFFAPAHAAAPLGLASTIETGRISKIGPTVMRGRGFTRHRAVRVTGTQAAFR
jgi:hypothetical protein